jgi:hypothetical protein
LDENVPYPLITALRSFVVRHHLEHVTEIGWSGTKDLDLYRRAAHEGFQAILTNDEKQLQRASEVEAIGLGVAIGTCCAGLPLALNALEAADSQRLIRLTGVDPTAAARLKIIDPAVEPPKYWPRRPV